MINKEEKCVLIISFTLLGIFTILFGPIHIDHFLRSDHYIHSKITYIYEQEYKVGKHHWIKKRVASTQADGKIELEIPTSVYVNDGVTYKKNYGPFGIVPTTYSFHN